MQYSRGEFVTGATLAEKVKKDFFNIKLKKAIVKVPGIRAKKPKRIKFREATSKDDKIPTSLLVHILIRNALENAKKERKEAKQAAKNPKYRTLADEKESAGGYGSASGFYGASPHKAYIDYGKLFSYLGKFRAKGSSYSDAPTEVLNSSTESKSFELVSREAMDKGARHVKYFFPKVADFYANLTSLVPVAGMSSAEWEQFKFMMKSDPAMYALKTKTA